MEFLGLVELALVPGIAVDTNCPRQMIGNPWILIGIWKGIVIS